VQGAAGEGGRREASAAQLWQEEWGQEESYRGSQGGATATQGKHPARRQEEAEQGW